MMNLYRFLRFRFKVESFRINREIRNLYYLTHFRVGDKVYGKFSAPRVQGPVIIESIKRSGCGHFGAVLTWQEEQRWINFNILTK